MNHPLTDDIIWSMWSEGDRSALAEEKLARAAADWQLEQAIEWLREHLPCKENGLVGYVYGDGFVAIDSEGVISDLKKAMRPQQQEKN